MAKLTKPQLELLAELAEQPQSLSMTYKPLQRLMALDYVMERAWRIGGTTFEVTEKGRAALASSPVLASQGAE